MRSFLYDARYALRALRRNPILAAVALLSLGIGIGANTAIFTLMDRMLLRSLPVRDADRLVLLASPGGKSGYIDTAYNDQVSFSWPKFQALEQQAGSVFDGMLARVPFGMSLSVKGQTDRARGELVSGSYFGLLGVRPALGRLIEEQDARTRGGNPVAVLSYGYWTSHFGARTDILNQSILVNGHPLTVVGVVERRFSSVGAGEAPVVFVPITMITVFRPGWEQFDKPHAYWLNIFGKLKPGVSPERAAAALAPTWHNILAADAKDLPARTTQEYRQKYVQGVLEVRPGANGLSAVRDDFRLPLYLLMGMVGLVLLIACANVANLLLARAAARGKEIAIRVSLGATRGRLIRHLLAESAILSLGGGLLGLLLLAWCGDLLIRLMPGETPVAGLTADPDGRMLAFAFAVSILTGLLFGCVPAFSASRLNPAAALNQQATALSGGGHARFRKVLVVGQIAFSVLLLGIAGLFARSLFNLKSFNPGFRAEQLVEFTIDPQLSGYDSERSLRLFDALHQGLSALPGVARAGMAKVPLLSNSMDMSSYRLLGGDANEVKDITLNQNYVGAGFFGHMGIALLTGREFASSDTARSQPVAVVNEAMVRKYLGGMNPLGVRMQRRNRTYEIVGVVKNAKYDDLREQTKPFVYLVAAQDAQPAGMTFYVRSRLPLESLVPSLRQAVRQLDPDLPVSGIETVQSQILDSVFLDRMVAALSLAFAGLATVLAAVGLYGVIAWTVTRRTREIGIRMALGAKPGKVMQMVLREVMWLGVIGIAIAVPAWVLVGRVLRSLLFGVSANDPATLASAVGILAAAGAMAGFVPAFRAARIDPIVAMRPE
jgi:predicted permease